MRRLSFGPVVALALALAVPCLAQTSLWDEIKAMPSMAKTALGITAEQGAALDAIYESACAEAKALSTAQISDGEKLTKCEGVVTKFLTSSIGVLTPSQIDMALTMGYAWVSSHGAATAPKAEVTKQMKACGLTDAQIASIYASFADHCTKASAIQTATGLTEQDRETELWTLRQTTFDQVCAGLGTQQQQEANVLLKSAVRIYTAVRAKLDAAQRPKLDALLNAVLSFGESKLTLK